MSSNLVIANPFAPVPVSLVNPDFQADSASPPGGWALGGTVGDGIVAPTSTSFDTTTQYDGTQSLIISWSGAATNSGISSLASFSVTPNQVYVLSAAMMVTTGAVVASIALQFYDASGNYLGSSSVLQTGNSVWTNLTITGIVPAGAVAAFVTCYNNGTTGSAEYAAITVGLSIALQYYLSLVTSEYQSSPNFLAWLTALLTPIIDTAICASSMYKAFDINLAVGVQLDALGQILGQSRTVTFTPSGGVSPILTDEVYRILLLATVARNTWSGQIRTLYSIWQTLFPGGVITVIDGMNMTATILVAGSFNSIIKDLISNGYIIPRPQGVQYTISFAVEPILGFDLNNAFIAGWDTGHWA